MKPILRKLNLPLTAACLGLALAMAPAPRGEGIPEPDLIWYGKVLNQVNGQTVRLTAGTVTWTVQPKNGGQPRVLSVVLTNINDQFSYVARLTCETPLAGFPASPDKLPITSPAVAFDRANATLNGQPLLLLGAPTEFTLSADRRGRIERIDLSLSASLEDSDGDGLPDAWENQYFPNGGANPGDDSDGDGVPNAGEYQAGTNPTDPASLFAIVNIVPGDNGITVQWSSVSGKFYRLLRSSELTLDGTGFEVIQSNIAATPPLNSILDADATSGALHFYRIQVQE